MLEIWIRLNLSISSVWQGGMKLGTPTALSLVLHLSDSPSSFLIIDVPASFFQTKSSESLAAFTAEFQNSAYVNSLSFSANLQQQGVLCPVVSSRVCACLPVCLIVSFYSVTSEGKATEFVLYITHQTVTFYTIIHVDPLIFQRIINSWRQKENLPTFCSDWSDHQKTNTLQ